MGHTILLQWSIPSPRGSTSQSDIISARVLEHYHIQYSARSNVTVKTFKARGKVLSIYQYTYSNKENEDIAYLLLEDRTAPDQQDSNTGVGEFINIDGTEGEEKIEDGREKKRRKHTPYQTLAVKPSGAVVPMLQNLLNPFVMGISKSARQAASTTAQKVAPTALTPITSTIPGFLFPALTEPFPPITLTLHIPTTNGQARHIFLEAEYNGHVTDSKIAESILREFLEGCIPEGAGGDYKWYTESEGDGGLEGPERQRRLTLLLGRCMKEGGL